MRILLVGLWLTVAFAAATPLWQPTNFLHTSMMARNIRHLPCVSRRTGESGTCMFAFSCAKLNGTHLGTCIDRFYFGSCCKVPEEGSGGDLDLAPPIDDNSLDGTTTARIRPAVTQKPLVTAVPPSSSTQYSSSTPAPSQGTQGISASTPGLSSSTHGSSSTQFGSTHRPSSPQPGNTHRPSSPSFGSTLGPSSTPSYGSSHGPSSPSFSTTQRPSTTSFSSTPRPSSPSVGNNNEPGSSTFGSTHGPSTSSFGSSHGPSSPSYGSTYGPGSATFGSTHGSSPPTFGSSHGPGSPTYGSTLGPSSAPPSLGSTLSPGGISTQGFGSTLPQYSGGSSSGKPASSPSQGPPLNQQPTTAPPTLVTWTTIEEGTGKPPPISIRPQVSEVSGGTHRPTLVSSTAAPTTQRPVASSTLVLPISTIRPSVSTSHRPPPSTAHPHITSATQRPASSSTSSSPQQVPVSTIRPPSTASKPSLVTGKPKPTPAKPKPSTAKPSSNSTRPQGKPPTTTKRPTPPRPAVSTGKPKPPTQKPPAKPVVKPKPTSKPKPPAKPAITRPPTTTTTTGKPISTTTQAATSETWVPISVSTHEPSTTQATSAPPSQRPSPSSPGTTAGPPASSTTLGGGGAPSTASVALPSVMSTSPSPQSNYTDSLNMSNYRDVCGRRLFPESRVVGGDKSSFGKWPWQISLRQWRTSTYLHKCGAALLNENWAITAAHCVENVPPSDLLLRLGEHDLSIEDEPFGYQERRVQIVASHPQFDPRTFEYDLALLRFYEPVVFQPNIIPICVPEDDTNFVGTTAYVTGWGRLYEDGPLPSVLQEVSVPVINNTLCETMYRAAGYIEHIPDIFICAGWKKGGFDSCEGDSGGPMVIQRPDKRWLLAGVISWGIGCAEPNQPGVYTRISQFRHWINQILQF